MNVFNPRRAFSKRMHSSSEELANIIGHGIGLIAALIGAPILLLAARDTGATMSSTVLRICCLVFIVGRDGSAETGIINWYNVHRCSPLFTNASQRVKNGVLRRAVANREFESHPLRHFDYGELTPVP
jgi:hypothetical protein